jgi:hypothetical protein
LIPLHDPIVIGNFELCGLHLISKLLDLIGLLFNELRLSRLKICALLLLGAVA